MKSLTLLALLLANQAPIRLDTLPKGATATTRLPTVIALHGRGGDAANFATFVRQLAPEARIISLQAPTPMELRGFTWFSRRVNDADEATLSTEIHTAAQALLPRLTTGPARCGKPILVGYSQGGVLALALAAQRIPGLAAFVDLAGALPPSYPVATTGPATPVLSLHAKDDLIVPIEATRRAHKKLQASGVPVTAVELPGGHDPTPELKAQAAKALHALMRAECPEAFRAARPDAGQP